MELVPSKKMETLDPFDLNCFLFSDDVQVQLCRHLLKTVCSDIVNQAVGLLAADHMLTINDDSALTPEVRVWCQKRSRYLERSRFACVTVENGLLHATS